MTSGALTSPFGRRKTVDEAVATTEEESFRLKKDVGALDVLVLGVGVIVGAGIFVLTGVAAATEAGPGIVLSFVLAAVVCAFAALCYAELAAMVPVAGSAYTFSYVTLGEFIAFIIGWDLVLCRSESSARSRSPRCSTWPSPPSSRAWSRTRR